jgi:methylated-DNA-protein-cysteine methyltransferase related protein
MTAQYRRAVPADFRRRVIDVIASLQPGEVVSYGDVAAQAGYPGAARGVGAVLAASHGLPWWRVVMASGRLAPGKEDEQSRRLKAEGVAVVRGRIAR